MKLSKKKKIIILIPILIILIVFSFEIYQSRRNTNILPPTETTQANISLVDGQQCYTYSHEATADAPYTVNEFINININGENVVGSKKGTQNGPDMTNGYDGKIVGTLNNNTITDIFSYTIEGSKNQEKEIYRANKTGIEKLRYPLIEEGGILVPDMTKEFSILQYARVGCTASN